MPQPKDKDWLYGYKIKTPIYVVSEKAMAPHSSTLPGKSHGRRSLVGCSPWGREELYTTARLHFHFSLSWVGEGNGNPLQCSCLENPRDGGAWWAAIYGVAQSQTWLKQLSSSIYVVYKRPTSKQGTHIDWKWRAGKRYSMQIETKRKQKQQYSYQMK